MEYDALFFSKPLEYKGIRYSVRGFMGLCACLFIDLSDAACGNRKTMKLAGIWREAYRELSRLNSLLIRAI